MGRCQTTTAVTPLSAMSARTRIRWTTSPRCSRLRASRSWRDTESLWPGQDWKAKIRQAITDGAFAFVACFSSIGLAKRISGQYPELYLAAEEHRRRRPRVPWILPVRLDDCVVPTATSVAGRRSPTSSALDLFRADRDEQLARLVKAVKAIINELAPVVATATALPSVVVESPAPVSPLHERDAGVAVAEPAQPLDIAVGITTMKRDSGRAG